MGCPICAGSASGVLDRTSCKRQGQRFEPAHRLPGRCTLIERACPKAWNESPTCGLSSWPCRGPPWGTSSSFLAGHFGSLSTPGDDPLTWQQIRLRSTVKDEFQAQIELGRLLKEASEGHTPGTDATVARLMDEYAAIPSTTKPGRRGTPPIAATSSTTSGRRSGDAPCDRTCPSRRTRRSRLVVGPGRCVCSASLFHLTGAARKSGQRAGVRGPALRSG